MSAPVSFYEQHPYPADGFADEVAALTWAREVAKYHIGDGTCFYPQRKGERWVVVQDLER